MPKISSNYNKTALLAYKEKILHDIKYYEQRIKDIQVSSSSKTYYEEGYSSDSEDDFPSTVDAGPSVAQLKIQQSLLRTCFQATQELTSLQVLESEVNVMVEDPALEGELPIKEPGMWREVTAECHIDLVPFSIMFYVHQPSRQFSSPSYRGLKVLPVKAAHEAELSTSVLSGVSRPADSIQVLRCYASAYRSRRTTLARLADKYASNLYMEPMAKGGYLLKCADLLEVSWRLENKWSPVGAFHHKLKFDLEYMNESYVRIITQAHKQLSDPTLDTDERTQLLAKIISTCLEARGTKEIDSMESDVESVNRLEKRRVDEDAGAPDAKKMKEHIGDGGNETASENRDGQIMAPPKSLPKKVKSKGKENVGENRKAVKRTNVEGGVSNVKKAKTNYNNVITSVNYHVEAHNELENEKNKTKNYNRNHIDGNTVNIDKNKGELDSSQINEDVSDKDNAKDVKKLKKKQDINQNVDERLTKNADKVKPNDVQGKTENQAQEKVKKRAVKDIESQKVTSKDKTVVNSKNYQQTKEVQNETVTKTDKNIVSSKTDPKTKESKDEKLVGKDKNMANTKSDLKSAENTTRNNTVDSTNAETQKQKDKPSKTVKKQDNNNLNKVKTSKNQKSTKHTNDNETKNLKNSANARKDIASAKRDIEKARTDIENARRDIENSKKLEDSNGSGANITSSVANKQSNDNDKAVNKETDIKTAKNSKAENAILIKEKSVPTKITNNKIEVNLNKAANPKSDTQNTVKNIETHKNKAQMAKANPKNADKITAKTKINEEIAPETPQVPKDLKINNNSNNNSNEKHTAEKAKVKKVAIKTKEHTDNIVASAKNETSKKTQNIHNKITIKNLSHKNPSAKDKLSRKSTGNTDGKVKAGSTAKNLKTLVDNSAVKICKIPQKNISLSSDNAIKRIPLRISPRKFPSTFKKASSSDMKQKKIQNITHIPRLLKKSEPKPR